MSKYRHILTLNKNSPKKILINNKPQPTSI